MRIWYPGRQQWWVIWSVFALAYLVSCDWEYMNPPMEAGTFITFLVIAGALVIWWLSGKKQN